MNTDEYGMPRPRTLAEVREEHPPWRIGLLESGRLLCEHGAWRFIAEDPDDAHAGIVTRETPWAAMAGSVRA